MEPRIVITGASRGFGAALAETFAARGAQVFAGTRDIAGARTSGVPNRPERVTPVQLDVTKGESVSSARDFVAGRASAIDVLVNSAAIRSATVSNPIETIDFADVASTFDVNTWGPLRVVQAFLPLLRRGHSPILVNISSEAGSIGASGREREFDYCMSKAALNMATVLLANYLRGQVRVLALHPGWLRTDMGGPTAALDPRAAAENVATLIAREAEHPSAALFVDQHGATLPW